MTIADALEMSRTHTAQLVFRQTRWLGAQAPGGGYLVVRLNLGHAEGWRVQSLGEMALLLAQQYPPPPWRWSEVRARWKPVHEPMEQLVGLVDYRAVTF